MKSKQNYLAILSKMVNNIKSVFFIILLSFFGVLYAQSQQILIHSHNDYQQRVPFYQAYACNVYSIEVDIFNPDGKNDLFVAHEAEELTSAPTIDDLYLKPIVELFKRNQGRAWKNSNDKLQLLIDLKTPAVPTLDVLVSKLKAYPGVFDPAINPHAVRIVISGNRPEPSEFTQYPSFILFDGNLNQIYTPEELNRIALFSEPFDKYSKWNGKGYIIDSEKKSLEEVIQKAHSLGKPIRFWGTPDYITAWNVFHTMGIDYINTDKPEACTGFFRDFNKKNFSIAQKPVDTNGDTVKPRLLDKVTSSFQGFDNNSRYLNKPVPVYTPTYKNDGTAGQVKNVILLIGDGMGLAALHVAETVNKGLTTTQLKHIGLQKTHANDDYTPDSAGAGSSIATGKPNNNRHISMSKTGEIYPSIPEILAPKGIACGVVTLGPIADATPAAFYGHTTERDNSDEITQYLLQGSLTLLAGSGMNTLIQRADKRNLAEELQPQYSIIRTTDRIKDTKGKLICIDERMGLATSEENLGLLADATAAAIRKLASESYKGFFLMVEGAKIDYAGHANSLPSEVMETLGFDLAVSEALKFADQNGETLVIVTADHETGGLTLIDGNQEKGHITAIYTTDDHTPVMVPVFAYGPEAQLFNGIYPNTEIFTKILKSISY